MDAFLVALMSVWNDSGFAAFTIGNGIMMLVGILLLYLAVGKGFEPLLLAPIAFGCILANVPKTGFETDPGIMQIIIFGINNEIFPPLIFLGVGAMTDFGPLIANPKMLLLGAAAQAGVFVALIGALFLGFTVQEAAAIGIIGGADGPTAIYLAAKMAPQLLGAIAVAAYSYMSLVPLIQPPIMKLFTTKKEREIKMAQLRTVSHFEKMVFPVVTTIFISLLLPPVCALIGMLMLGNLFTEAGCLDRLSDTAQNALMNIVTIMLATGTGLTMKAENFLTYQTILIISLGLVAFAAGTAMGVLFGKLMSVIDGGQTNPLIGSAGVSAVPMAARVSQIVGQKANPSNFLLMHAMGPNVAGVIGTAVAAGTMLAMIGPVAK
ncbi:Glutaconyl-CoA decarboxylase subunit beta [bioreactor metagenome]|uniref:Glutaconyl-CoA decarboxylase subunit beta n=1 Tax=bioreactor metagenome TaxID=1076179 RepID=A0A644VW23_9ZZZZ|nr:sodium ion-translocating decarboxylase subunit beta [Acidaminococcaceae bacterium]